MKFDDQTIYKLEEFTHILQVILKVFLLCSFCYLANLSFTLSNGSYIYTELQFQVVLEHAKDRPVMFSSFQPDAAQLMRKLQNKYPVRSLVSLQWLCFILKLSYSTSSSEYECSFLQFCINDQFMQLIDVETPGLLPGKWRI